MPDSTQITHMNSRTLASLSPLIEQPRLAVIAAAALCFCIASDTQAQNLVTNGDFESVSNPNGGLLDNPVYNTSWSQQCSLTGWTGTEAAFSYAPNTIDTTGSAWGTGQWNSVVMAGPNNGSANGLPGTSPAGGYFVAIDGEWAGSGISQLINNLSVGTQYNLTFSWAQAEQIAYGTASTNWLTVGLGSDSQDTTHTYLSPNGYVPWQSTTMTFTATNTSELLSFAGGSTSTGGVPPFLLLDGVSLVAVVPEPSNSVLIGASAITLLYRRRRSAMVAAVSK